MKSRLLFLLLVSCLSVKAQAQPQLFGFIGAHTVPDDSEGICIGPTYTIKAPWDFNYIPEFPIQTINEVQLYTNDSVPVTASKLLATGKPLVFIDGSYTCDIFRNMIPQINQIYLRYKDSISMYVVYTLEAHPIVDPNFYRTGQNWVVPQDSTDHVLYRQPKTYGERRAMVDTMMKRQTSPSLLPPIIIDAPCNQWWQTFGPAPNCAYLIAADGHVVKHQPWFNQYWPAGQQPQPDFLSKYIDSLLHPEASHSAVHDDGTPRVRVWPNPVSIGSTVHLSSEAPVRFALFDMLGRQVMMKEANDNVSIVGLTAGSYFYKLEGATTQTGRLIITP